MDFQMLNISVPRYTSYPTVPFWKTEAFEKSEYEKSLINVYWESSRNVSLYIHLPFCERLCTYCACNTRITKNHKLELPYVNYLLKEWALYLDKLPEKPTVKEIHLGGGTPTFFAPENLEKLIEGILKSGVVASVPQFSFEGHPANTTASHLHTLRKMGFNRVSYGIQDFDIQVQKLINRIQSFDQVKVVTEEARALGYESVNYDLIYGLPGQTEKSLSSTIEKVITLKPERIAYYSYAHVPQLKPAQKSFERHLPSVEEKHTLRQIGKERLLNAGYLEIGMDHFVLPSDELVRAQTKGDLHRNFMGYTPFTSKLLIGLGVSAISDSWSSFAQNEKTVNAYYAQLDQGKLPIARGHLHTATDLFIRKHILNLMCNFHTTWMPQEFIQYGLSFNHELLARLEDANHISYSEEGLQVNYSGREIIRIICSALDPDFNLAGQSPCFSKSI